MPRLRNRQVKLAARPVGNPRREDFAFETVEVAPLAEGDVLVKVSHLSLDPAMRGWMNAGRSYIAPVELGEVMRAGGAGEVIESNHAAFRTGDKVTGFTGVQEYAAVKGDGLQKVCGAISQYNSTTGVRGPANYLSLLVNRARMEGFVVFDYAKRYGEAVAAIAGWMAEGKLKVKEHVVEAGVDQFVETLNKLFAGENLGKMVMKIA